MPAYLGLYSLQSGSQFVNLQMSVPSPGGGFYIVPPGTIVINVPPGATTVSYMGCQSMVIQNIPPGASPSEILGIVSGIMQQVADQLAICNAPHGGGNPFLPGSFTNGPTFVGCGDGQQLQQIGDLPAGITFAYSGLTLVGGIFSSTTSQLEADQIAEAYLLTFFGVSVACGWWNTDQMVTCCDMTTQDVPAYTIFSLVSQADADAQALAQATAACPTCYWNALLNHTCPDSSVVTIPAHTYMSIISQADADAQALAAAIAECPTSPCQDSIDNISWNIVPFIETMPGSTTADEGVVTMSYASTGNNQESNITVDGFITNSSGSTCHYQIASVVNLSMTTPNCSPLNPEVVVNGVFSFAGNKQITYNDSFGSPPCQQVPASTPFTTTFTLPPGNSFHFGVNLEIITHTAAGGAVSVDATFTITLV